MAVSGSKSRLFVEYIGDESPDVTFSDVPINSEVDFHFICSFAIDYTTEQPHAPSDGNFSVFWDIQNLSPDAIGEIKAKHPNVKVAVSLGGASIGNDNNSDSDNKKVSVKFTATAVDTWVKNAVSSLTKIISDYKLDGIDIDYEDFSEKDNTDLFAQCIGHLITKLKEKNVISFASIAPFDDEDEPQRAEMYHALWANYSDVIDYVNYQFYGYNETTTVDDYVRHYDAQVDFYGEKVLASFMSNPTEQDKSFSPDIGYDACVQLENSHRKLPGIFIWSADTSFVRPGDRFTYERKCQNLLAN